MPADQQIPLSVLDLAPVSVGSTSAEALGNALDLAKVADRAGYHRYWLAEHHLAPGVAAASPAILIALIVGTTQRIRIGSGAVQIPNYSPLIIAEQFGTIAQLYPGRIDLGLGRLDLGKILRRRQVGTDVPTPRHDAVVDGLLVPAPGRYSGDAASVELLARLLEHELDGPPPDYCALVRQILSFVRGEFRAPSGEKVHAIPAEGADLQVWILGSSAGPSAQAAGELGLPYAGNYHISPSTVLESVAAYRAAFRPSPELARPHVMVSADVVVADDDATARELASPYAEWVLGIRTGLGAMPFGRPTDAARRRWTDDERAAVTDRTRTQIVGTPDAVVRRLRTLVAATAADELMVTTITHQHADRVRSFELLAEAWFDAAAPEHR